MVKILIMLLSFELMFAQNGIEIGGIDFGNLNISKGSGKIVTKRFTLNKFTKIKIDSSFDVTIQIGKKYGYSIKADDNLVNLISVVNRNGTLIVSTKGSYSTNSDIKLIIKTKRLESLVAEGSSNIYLQNLKEPYLSLNLDGSIDLSSSSGEVKSLSVKSDGAYDIDLSHIKVKSAKVELLGSGDLKMNVSHKLDAKVSDSATLYYSGNPIVTKTILDSGDLIKNL